MFLSNLILEVNYELKDRYMHIDYCAERNGSDVQSATENISKGKIFPLKCPLDESAILQLIIKNSNITQEEIALEIEKSERTVKNRIALLKEKGISRD